MIERTAVASAVVCLFWPAHLKRPMGLRLTMMNDAGCAGDDRVAQRRGGDAGHAASSLSHCV